VGVSFDTPEANAAWRTDQSFPYELWSDGEQRVLARALGAADDPGATYAQRVTVLLDEDARVVQRWNVRDIGAHPADVLERARTLVSE